MGCNLGTGKITQSFATGTITQDLRPTGGQLPAGIANNNEGSIGRDVYWDTQTTGATVGAAQGNAVPAAQGLTRRRWVRRPASGRHGTSARTACGQCYRRDASRVALATGAMNARRGAYRARRKVGAEPRPSSLGPVSVSGTRGRRSMRGGVPICWSLYVAIERMSGANR